jgi:hypothetical protein
MSVKKKAKRKSEGTAKKSKKKSTPRAKKSVDMGRVRENINNLVGASARYIANEVIKVARTGQLASAKYLFEAVGLYPPTEQAAANPVERSLAHTLLTRMGLPLDPVICDEEPATGESASDAKSMSDEVVKPGVAREDAEDADDEPEEELHSTPATLDGEE